MDNTIDYIEHFKKDETPEIGKALQIQKIKSLENLIECNDKINEAQIEFIATVIENANISASEKETLLTKAMKPGSKFVLDYQLLKDYEVDDDLLLEMVILVKRSGRIDDQECTFIYSVANDMQIDEGFVDDLLGSTIYWISYSVHRIAPSILLFH